MKNSTKKQTISRVRLHGGLSKKSPSIGLESCFKKQNVLTLLEQGDFYVLHMFHKNLRNFC